MLSLWCIFRSPLMLGAELPKLDKQSEMLLTNEKLFKMYREARGAQETYRDDKYIIWKSASDEKKYTAVFNITQEAQPMPVEAFGESAVEIWSGNLYTVGAKFTIPAHGVLLWEE